MNCRIGELKDKQVVSLKDASIIGYISDIEFNTESGSLSAIITSGKSRGISLLSGGEDIIIPWEKIEVIGNDSILVNFEGFLPKQRKRKGIIKSMLFGE